MYAVRSQTITSNEYYQKELVQCPRSSQLIVMSLMPQEEVPPTVDPNICKIIYVISGTGMLHIKTDNEPSTRKRLLPEMHVMIFPGSNYRIVNTGAKSLKMLINNTPPKQDFQNIKRPVAAKESNKSKRAVEPTASSTVQTKTTSRGRSDVAAASSNNNKEKLPQEKLPQEKRLRKKSNESFEESVSEFHV